MKPSLDFCLLPFALCLLPFCSAQSLVFSKSFPGSVPAYYEIVVESSGQAQYKEAPDDDQPLRFTLSPTYTKTLFALAEKLAFFNRPLESNLKVANMGKKTLRYQDGAKRQETTYNYSEDPDARILTDWFEKISETEQHLITLERVARFDRLGVNKALLHLETSWDRNRLAAPEQFLPILDRIAKGQSYLHMAQARAASLSERIRAAQQPAPTPDDPLDLELSGLSGDSLRLAAFRGKVQVLNFWATWCVPCRPQHAQLAAIRKSYPDVVFHSLNTDQDRSLVQPFIEQLGWPDRVYFADPLPKAYNVAVIPTIVILDKQGRLASSLPGFPPTSFEQLLTAQIDAAR